MHEIAQTIFAAIAIVGCADKEGDVLSTEGASARLDIPEVVESDAPCASLDTEQACVAGSRDEVICSWRDVTTYGGTECAAQAPESRCIGVPATSADGCGSGIDCAGAADGVALRWYREVETGYEVMRNAPCYPEPPTELGRSECREDDTGIAHQLCHCDC